MPGNPEGYIPDETGEEATDGNNEQVAAEKPETTLGSMGGVAVRPPGAEITAPEGDDTTDDLPSVPEVGGPDVADDTDVLDDKAENSKPITPENVDKVLFEKPAADTDEFLKKNVPELEEAEIVEKDIPEMSENDDPNAVVLEWNPDLALMPAGKFMEVVKEFVELTKEMNELNAKRVELESFIGRLKEIHEAIDPAMIGDLSRLMHDLSDSLDRHHIRADYGANDIDGLESTQRAYASALAGQIGELGRFEDNLDKVKGEIIERQNVWADKWGSWKEGDDASAEIKNDLV